MLGSQSLNRVGRGRTNFASLLVGLVVLPSLWWTPVRADAVCGNGVTEAGEDCDDGGTCIGGANAGQRCTAESDCQGSGVCVGGPKAEVGCADAAACPGGTCVRCVPQGGDGCAANCTFETYVKATVVPGQIDASTGLIKTGTSGATLSGNVIPFVVLPLTGHFTLAVGKTKDGVIPYIFKANAWKFDKIPVPNLGCVCMRGVAAKTCGGTLFEADGVTLARDCSAGFTPGASLCPADKPCTFVYGAGNAAQGIMGCNGLDGIDLTYTQDDLPAATTCAADSECPPGSACVVNANPPPAKVCGAFAPAIELGGHGGPGSAVLLASQAIGEEIGGCSPTFCTNADPQSSRGTVTILPAVTGDASGAVFHANGGDEPIGSLHIVGMPGNCAPWTGLNIPRPTLVGAFAVINQYTLLDIVVTTVIVPQGGTLVSPVICVGDCDRSGDVTVDEVLAMVNIALGDGGVTSCLSGDGNGDGTITIDEVLAAVNNIITGCGDT